MNNFGLLSCGTQEKKKFIFMQKFLLKIYLYKFFDDFILIYPFYVLMMANARISEFGISLALIVWSIITFSLEVPSGVLADKYSRKNILAIGQGIRVLGYLVWMIWPSFWGFLIGFAFWGIKSALTSGTFEALVYDELKIFHEEEKYTKILGRAQGFAFIGIICAEIGGALAINCGYNFVLILSIIAVLISGFIIYIIPLAKKEQSTHEKEYFSLLKQGLNVVVRDTTMFNFLIFISLITVLGAALDEYWSLYERGVGLTDPQIALFGGVVFIFYSVASFTAHRFKKLSHDIFCLLTILQGIIMFLGAYLWPLPLSLIFLLIYSFMWRLITTVYEGKMQDMIPEEVRATVSSVKSFMAEIMAVGVYLIYGFLSRIFATQTTFMAFGALVVGVGASYYLVNRWSRENLKFQNSNIK